jgi:hypothetical protein
MAHPSTLEELDERHTEMASAQSKKDLEQINWQINPNDIPWMLWDPRINKSLGRSKRVFYRLSCLRYP